MDVSEKNERENIIKTCFRRARKRICGPGSDSFNNHYYVEGLVEIWAAFESLLALNFRANRNSEMQNLICQKYQFLFEKWKKSPDYEESISRLQMLVPVKDMRPLSNNKAAMLNDKNNLSDIIHLSYMVFCNFKHGGKLLEGEDPIAKRNRELVKHSLRVTYEILDKILRNEGIIIDT